MKLSELEIAARQLRELLGADVEVVQGKYGGFSQHQHYAPTSGITVALYQKKVCAVIE